MSDPDEIFNYPESAAYRYDEALMEYESALASRDLAEIGTAEERLHEAARLLSGAQSALVAARSGPPARPSFTDLLSDPSQQFDPTGEVLRSILAHRTAVPWARPPRESDGWTPPATIGGSWCRVSSEGFFEFWPTIWTQASFEEKS